MQIRIIVLASLFVSAGAYAQSVPPAAPASDSWSAPAAASTAAYRTDAAVPARKDRSESHFKFKDRRSYTAPPGNAAQQQSGNAAVGAMGTDRNGRPAVNCPQTPMDPACH